MKPIRRSLLVLVVLVVGACGADGDPTASTGPTGPDTSSVTTSSTAPSSTTPPSTTPTTGSVPTTTATPPTTTVAPADPGSGDAGYLLAGRDGLLRVGPEGATDRIVEEPVAIATGDGAGGLLFQRGNADRDDEGEGPGTTIWWVPAGTGTAGDLLVPTAGETLGLVGVSGDGTAEDGRQAHVWYTRWSGEGIERRQTLRRYDPLTGAVAELAEVGGHESGSRISVGGSTIVRSWAGEGRCGMVFTDTDGVEVDVPAAPAGSARGGECGTVPHPGALSPDGSRLAYLVPLGGALRAVVMGTATGDEMAGFEVRPAGASWQVVGIDLGPSGLIVNRHRGDPSRPAAPLVFELGVTAPAAVEGPGPGVARWLTHPLMVDTPVVVP